jgi:hypothetical protein
MAGPLPLAARQAFRAAALGALARIPCLGPGIVYRTIAPLQRTFFDPPDWHRAAWDISQERPGIISKLVARPAIEHDVDGRHMRYRHSKAGG